MDRAKTDLHDRTCGTIRMSLLPCLAAGLGLAAVVYALVSETKAFRAVIGEWAARDLAARTELAAEALAMLLNILNNGLTEACVRDGFIRRSLTCYKGYLTHEETSGIQGRPWVRPEDILGIADRKLDPAPPATTTRSDNFYQKVEL